MKKPEDDRSSGSDNHKDPKRINHFGDLCAGNAFVLPVRALREQTIPYVSASAPPRNIAGFQAHAVFP
jgi:hypothetical protein